MGRRKLLVTVGLQNIELSLLNFPLLLFGDSRQEMREPVNSWRGSEGVPSLIGDIIPVLISEGVFCGS